MSVCPKCNKPIDNDAVKCPHCYTTLKAFGHAGIPLYKAEGESFLCDSCTYHEDDSCNFPKRPYAKDCTLYHDKSVPLIDELPRVNDQVSLTWWVKRNKVLLLVLLIIIISVSLALSGD